ncbi:11-beta-hydroxysteroid dehydrogenase-like 4A [Rutidosis leptorrhynchoides]|uniref:11-beta-hydroxysteroid dehydrogenase-like 4A n=1 Tax=Rutidosis leptorrhynchoides TaxID=125765 RepID=UPI003A99EE20
MYETYLNNNFIDALAYYILVLLIILTSPCLFIWELITTIRSCFKPNENVSEKVVLITGASKGIGEFMAYEYAKRGACLSLVSIKEPDSRLEQVADRARELGSPDVIFMFADVSSVEECRMFVDDTVKHFGRLDHLVCNAGVAYLYSTEIDVTKFEPVMDINFWGSVYPTHFAIPHLMETNGKIIVNASVAGVVHPPRGGFYNASKAALIAFYEALRFEVSPTITITILTLGFINTDIITAKYSTHGAGVHLRKDIRAMFPSMEAEPCTKAILDGVCKGATAITEPRFMKATFLINCLFPGLRSYYFNNLFPSDKDD